jgi:hypothetical protein
MNRDLACFETYVAAHLVYQYAKQVVDQHLLGAKPAFAGVVPSNFEDTAEAISSIVDRLSNGPGKQLFCQTPTFEHLYVPGVDNASSLPHRLKVSSITSLKHGAIDARPMQKRRQRETGHASSNDDDRMLHREHHGAHVQAESAVDMLLGGLLQARMLGQAG